VSSELSNYRGANRQSHLDDRGIISAPAREIDDHLACFTPSIGQDHGGRGRDRSATRPAAAEVVRRHVDVNGLDNEKTYLQASNGLNSVQEGNRQ
jgi:hypothetical protein